MLWVVACACGLIGIALGRLWKHDQWGAYYDELAVRASSYIDGLERLQKFPDAYVQETATKALQGLLA